MKLFLRKLYLAALVIAIASFVFSPVHAFADTTIDNAAFASKIADLQTKFKHGEYWNYYNSSDLSKTGKIPCRCVGYCRGDCTCQCGQFYYNGTRYGGQCHGYALKLGNLIFGNNPASWGTHSNASNIVPGDIVRANFTSVGSHTIFVYKVEGDNVYYTECNFDGPCLVTWGKSYTKTQIANKSGLIIYHASNNGWTANKDPRGALDEYRGELGTVYVRGWAIDDDTPNQSIDVHVYIDGAAGTGTCIGATTANKYRSDLNGNYGYEVTLPVSVSGTHDVYVHAINSTSGNNPVIGQGTVTINADYDSPDLSDIVISNITSAGYRVRCKVSDNVGISKIQFPSWTVNNDQDDLVWHDATIEDGVASCYIKTADHNREVGTYITHIYVWDFAGNQTFVSCGNIEVPSPITGFYISEEDVDGYTVTCNVDMNWGIKRVEFPTWTENDGQDDLIWHAGSISDGKATCRINVADHGNQRDCTYVTHIYVWDSDVGGNSSSTGLTQYVPSSYKYTVSYYDELVKLGKEETVIGTSKSLEYTISDYIPVKEGHTFLGWLQYKIFLNPVNITIPEYVQGDKFSIESNFSLLALWKLNQYTVSFNSNGGTEVNAQTLYYDTNITKPSDPEKAGYSFAGWYDGDDLFDFSTTPIKGDLTLDARWEEVIYTVIFDSAGGEEVRTQRVKPGSKATEPADPKKEGYVFQGWYLNEQLFDFVNTGITSDITLVGKWQAVSGDGENPTPLVTPSAENPSTETSTIEEPSAEVPLSENTPVNIPPQDVTTPDILPTETTAPTEANEEHELSKTATVSGIEYTVDQTRKTATIDGSSNKAVKKISIPATIELNGNTYKVTEIAVSAFKGMKKLTEVTIGGNITVIGDNAFYGCTKLKSVTGGKKVATIGKQAFYGCKKLSAITLYSKVSSIGKKAFYNCSSLKTITIKTAKLKSGSIGSNAFKGIKSNATFKCPKKKLADYKTILLKKGATKKMTVK